MDRCLSLEECQAFVCASLSITEIHLAHTAWNLDLAGHLEVIHTGQAYTSAPSGDSANSDHQSEASTF